MADDFENSVEEIKQIDDKRDDLNNFIITALHFGAAENICAVQQEERHEREEKTMRERHVKEFEDMLKRQKAERLNLKADTEYASRVAIFKAILRYIHTELLRPEDPIFNTEVMNKAIYDETWQQIINHTNTYRCLIEQGDLIPLFNAVMSAYFENRHLDKRVNAYDIVMNQFDMKSKSNTIPHTNRHYIYYVRYRRSDNDRRVENRERRYDDDRCVEKVEKHERER